VCTFLHRDHVVWLLLIILSFAVSRTSAIIDSGNSFLCNKTLISFFQQLLASVRLDLSAASLGCSAVHSSVSLTQQLHRNKRLKLICKSPIRNAFSWQLAVFEALHFCRPAVGVCGCFVGVHFVRGSQLPLLWRVVSTRANEQPKLRFGRLSEQLLFRTAFIGSSACIQFAWWVIFHGAYRVCACGGWID